MGRGRLVLAAACAWILALQVAFPRASEPQSPSRPQPSSTAPSAPTAHRATLDRYCVSCHNERLKTAGVVLDQVDLARVGDSPELWEKVIRKVRSAQMPPPGGPRPDAATRQALVDSLITALDTAAAATPNPGRPVLHRLNRTQYANAVRDLLDLDVDVSALLPPDDSAFGFDNVGDALGVSPLLVEQYLSAAAQVSAVAVGGPDVSIAARHFEAPFDRSQNVHVPGMPLGTIGGIRAEVTLPLDGDYDVRAFLARTNTGIIRGLESAHTVEFTVDGQRVHMTPIGGTEEFAASMMSIGPPADAVDRRMRVRLPLKAGPHVITVAFVAKTRAVDPRRLQQPVRSSLESEVPIGNPHLQFLTITGPFDPTGPGDTPSRRRIFNCRPAKPAEELPCARQILSTLARRAYRGHASAEDVTALLRFYETGRAKGHFERGIELALRRLLTSPKFVLRFERQPAEPPPVYRVNDFDLASRLSFFLWSSIPDDTLLQLAAEGRLSKPAVLEAQVRRMLADARAETLAANFAMQWLGLRNLSQAPDEVAFPDFDDNLRQAMGREVLFLFRGVMNEDRSVLDLLTAKDTYLNERLAKHYGIPHIYGSHFRRVELAEDVRAGLLGKGAILMVTSQTNRTSPVNRGKWVLENILGAPPPPPPPAVPPLDENARDKGSDRVLTMRERMEKHRSNPACAGCHRLMDPVGLAMENFDAVGAWRTRDGGTYGTPIDAQIELVDGTTVNGVVELRGAVLRQPEMFVETLTAKLMTYALGRGVLAPDMPSVRQVVRQASEQRYRFSSIVLGIVNSAPFQMSTPK